MTSSLLPPQSRRVVPTMSQIPTADMPQNAAWAARYTSISCSTVSERDESSTQAPTALAKSRATVVADTADSP
jgi:hypothetical protein